MNRISILILVLITSLAPAAVGCSGNSSDTKAKGDGSPPSTVAAVAAPPALPTSPSAAPAPAPSTAGMFAVGLQDPGGSGSYVFDPTDLSFSVGETVTFALTSENEFHTFTVDDLDIDEGVESGETVELSFTFDTAGTYELICVPHQSLGMVGTITVQ